MKILVAVWVLTISSFACSQSTSTGPATASGACAVAHSGNRDTVIIKCGIGAEQGKQLIEILNKILANQQKLSPDVVMQKLDEILKAVNPNVPQKTYYCNGLWRTVGPGANADMVINSGGDTAALQQMIFLVNARKFDELRYLCIAQMKEKPEWLTPYLACGIAYLGLGDKLNAAKMLKDFDYRTGPAYDVDACKQMSDYLHANLNQ
jgi:hypothetical protein